MPEFIPLVAAMRDVFMGLVMVLFVLSTLLLMLVILIQEGKGGGITGVFGGGFTETFGVKAGTVNRFTAYLAAAFLFLALLYAGLSAKTEAPKLKELPSVPAGSPSETPGAPGDTVQPGGTPGETPPTPPSGETPPPTPPAGETPPPTPPQTPPSPPENPPAPPGGEKPPGEQPR